MSTHPNLRINAETSRKTIIEFLEKVAISDKSGGKSHLRAVEKTYLNSDGTSSTVTKLFVRSGRESPIKWFKNLFNSERQYGLAARVLQTRLQYAVSHDEDPKSELSSALSKSSSILTMAGLKPEYRKKGVPLSIVTTAFPKPVTDRLAPMN